jgi:hypothetical protein
MTKKYMEFYYPTTGKVTYNIVYDWGEYIITTEDKLNTDVHVDSKPYLGYITFRPMVSGSFPDQKEPFYLITPGGDVWENKTGHGIPERGNRQEITKKKTDSGTSTQTLTFESVSEPIIDHFKTNPGQWIKLGKLEVYGKKTRLKLV